MSEAFNFLRQVRGRGYGSERTVVYFDGAVAYVDSTFARPAYDRVEYTAAYMSMPATSAALAGSYNASSAALMAGSFNGLLTQYCGPRATASTDVPSTVKKVYNVMQEATGYGEIRDRQGGLLASFDSGGSYGFTSRNFFFGGADANVLSFPSEMILLDAKFYLASALVEHFPCTADYVDVDNGWLLGVNGTLAPVNGADLLYPLPGGLS